jgi:hypothetical protein
MQSNHGILREIMLYPEHSAAEISRYQDILFRFGSWFSKNFKCIPNFNLVLLFHLWAANIFLD